jgi:hypothetical protein
MTDENCVTGSRAYVSGEDGLRRNPARRLVPGNQTSPRTSKRACRSQVRKLRSEGTQVDDKFVVVWKARKVDCVHPEVASTLRYKKLIYICIYTTNTGGR